MSPARKLWLRYSTTTCPCRTSGWSYFPLVLRSIGPMPMGYVAFVLWPIGPTSRWSRTSTYSTLINLQIRFAVCPNFRVSRSFYVFYYSFSQKTFVQNVYTHFTVCVTVQCLIFGLTQLLSRVARNYLCYCCMSLLTITPSREMTDNFTWRALICSRVMLFPFSKFELSIGRKTGGTLD